MSVNWSPWSTVNPQSKFDRKVEVPGGIRWVPPDMLVLGKGQSATDRPIVAYMKGVVIYHNLRPLNFTGQPVVVGGVTYEPVGRLTEHGPKRTDGPTPGEAATAPAIVADEADVKHLRSIGWWWPIVLPVGRTKYGHYRRFLWVP